MIINKSYEFLKTDKSRHVHIYGGAGSGKSVAIAQYIMLDLTSDKEINWLILRKYGTSITDTTHKELKDAIYENGVESAFKITEKRRFVCCNGNFAIMKGLDDPEKVKSIKGITKVWLEEATEFTEADIRQIWLRLRGVGEKKQFYYSYNPVDADHFIKRHFFDIEQPNTTIKHTTYRDNKFIDDDYKAELQSYEKADHYYYMVYALGEWGVITEAKVFHNVKIWDYDWEALEGIKWGMDFGFTHAATLMGTAIKENDLYILPELYHKGMTSGKWVKKVDKFDVYDRNLYITADEASPDWISDLKDANYKITATKKVKGMLRMGVNYLLGFDTINIHRTLCPNTAIEFQNFKRRELKDGTIVEGEFVEIRDDTIAGIRYSREDEVKRRGRKQTAPGVSKTGLLGW